VVDSASNRNEYQEFSWGLNGGRCIRLTNLPPSVSRLSRENVRASMPQPYGPSRPIRGIAFVCTYMCPIPNGFRDNVISLYSSNFVDKKQILRTVSNTGIYCSSDKVGTVYIVQYIFEKSTVNINAFCNSCENMACCSSVQCGVYCRVI
jgi:hypothetical protein